MIAFFLISEPLVLGVDLSFLGTFSTGTPNSAGRRPEALFNRPKLVLDLSDLLFAGSDFLFVVCDHEGVFVGVAVFLDFSYDVDFFLKVFGRLVSPSREPVFCDRTPDKFGAFFYFLDAFFLGEFFPFGLDDDFFAFLETWERDF